MLLQPLAVLHLPFPYLFITVCEMEQGQYYHHHHYHHYYINTIISILWVRKLGDLWGLSHWLKIMQ